VDVKCDRNIIKFTSILMYNTICKSKEKRLDLLRSQDCKKVLVCMLDAMFDDEGVPEEDECFDWLYLLFKSFLEWFPVYYDIFTEDSIIPSGRQVKILKLLEAAIGEEQFIINEISEDFIILELKRLSELTLNQKVFEGYVIEGTSEFLRILIDNPNIKDKIRESETLKPLIQLLDYLVGITQKRNNNKHPVFGLKQEIVKLIANISYNNINNQNAIREEGGLIPILNCCVIEDANPLLKEWSLYAIRNLTIDNELNQEFISSLKAEKKYPIELKRKWQSAD